MAASVWQPKASDLESRFEAFSCAMVGARARDHYDELAKERMEAGKGDDGSGGRGHKRNPPANLPEGSGDARDAVGKAVGVR